MLAGGRAPVGICTHSRTGAVGSFGFPEMMAAVPILKAETGETMVLRENGKTEDIFCTR